jgi:hypothetical protein
MVVKCGNREAGKSCFCTYSQPVLLAARCQASKATLDEILALVAKYMKELVG